MNKKLSFLLVGIASTGVGAGILIGTRLAARGTGQSHSTARWLDFSHPFRQKEVFRENALAHKLLDGLRGIEIGSSAHNAFGLNTLNVNYTDDRSLSENYEGPRAWDLRGELKARGGGNIGAHRRRRATRELLLCHSR